jgi:CBS domain-containing protein
LADTDLSLPLQDIGIGCDRTTFFALLSSQVGGGIPMKRTCKEVMTTDPVCCTSDDTVQKAAQLMKSEDIGAIPVIDNFDNYKLVGIVTDRDLAVRVVAEDRDAGTTMIREVMKEDPYCCKNDDNVQDVIDTMSKHQVRRIPVVDRDRRVIGIIAQADIATRLKDLETTGEVVAEISK